MQFRLFRLRRIGMEIGEDTWIYSDKLETNEPYLVKIGSHTMIAPEVAVLTHDASAAFYIPDSTDLFGSIFIGDHCFIGYGAILCPGVKLADHCIVGAGAVVTKSFLEPGTVISGNPAKQLMTVDELREKNTKYALDMRGLGEKKKEYLLNNQEKFKGYHPDYLISK